MDQVLDRGTPAIEAPARLSPPDPAVSGSGSGSGPVSAVGVDETAYLRATSTHATAFATGIADLTPGRPARLLDVVEGRSGSVLASWRSAQDRTWRAGIDTASLDPFRGYATALTAALPGAVRVLDPFHVVKLGLACVDDVRRRVQQDTLGHRGRARDPLYGIRRVLRRRRDRLSTKARGRLAAGLIAGDPDGEVTLAWTVAQDRLPPAPPRRYDGEAMDGLSPPHGHVRSTRSALPALPLVGFSGSPPEPGVHLSAHRALHKSRRTNDHLHAVLGHDVGMRVPR
jgi:hypothetical protein